MRKPFVSLLLFLFLNLTVNGQQETSLRIPGTPAFSILNFEPSSILKPGNLKDIGGDILNSFDGNGKLKMNLGLEVMPYWLSSRSNLTNQKYNAPTTGQSILQSLSISAATVKDSVTNKDKLGIGFRFCFLNGKTNPDYDQKQQELLKLQKVESLTIAGRTLAASWTTIEEAKEFFFEGLDQDDLGLTSEERTELKQLASQLAEQFPNTTSGIVSFFETLNKKLGIQHGAVVSKVYELSKKRVGFFLEIAGATGFSGSEKGMSLERAGIWLTASEYYNASNAWHINARYQFSNRDTSVNNFDAGFAYTKEMSKFSLGAEGMVRWYRAIIPDLNSSSQPILRLEKEFTYRLAVQSSYMITDGISINLSFGKNFDSPYLGNEGFFSIFGMNYTLFKKVKVPVI